MGDYFKPLRRKIGVVTLVVACMFAATWVRGFVRCDLFNLPNQLAIANDRKTLSLVKPRRMPHGWGITNFSSQYRVWNGVELVPVFVVPYWSIVITLTLLSAWLLLSKPRATTQKKNRETPVSEGT